jgi:hypothetical protein
MVGSTFIQVPHDVNDATSLKRFLQKLVEQLDIAFGNRGDAAFVTSSTSTTNLEQLQNSINAIASSLSNYSTLDGSRDYTGIVGYNIDKTFTTSTDIISKKYADDLVIGLTSNPEQVAITSLAQTISATYVQGEVQAISSKVDAILVALRNANIIVG